MKKVFFVALSTLSFSYPALSQWVPQTSPTSKNLYDVKFVGQQFGWIAGSEVLLRTVDGGGSWNKQDLPGYYLDELYFIDTSIGWAVGSTEFGRVPGYGLRMKTMDGGNSWAIIDSSQTGYFDSIYFVDDRHGWIAGGQGPWPDTLGLILKTNDGGDSWVRVDSGKVSSLRDIFFIDILKGWAVGDYGYIYKSTDGGISWQLVTQAVFLDGIFEAPLRQVYFATEDSGWVAGGLGGTQVIGRTTDAGNTWQFDLELAGSTLHGLWFIDSERGWAVGGWGMIFYTSDGGNNWTLQQQVVVNYDKPGLESVCMINENEGWIVGRKGMILKTTKGGLTSVENSLEGVPSGFKLFQNYPNPFNPTTTISFQLPNSSFVTIRVFDILGREVATILNDIKPAGTHEFEFNASGLPNGIYFYQFQAGAVVETKKFVLLK